MEQFKRSHLLRVTEEEFINIRKIYNFDKPEHLNQAIDILKSWLEKQNHILNKDIFSLQDLEIILVMCKGSIEKAKRKIDRLATMRTLLPKFFIKFDIKLDLKDVHAMITPLPKQTKEFHRIILIKYNFKQIQTHQFITWFRFNVILTEYIKAHDYVDGLKFIHDVREANLMDVVTNINPVELQQINTILTEGYGARILGIYFLSQSKTIEVLLKTIKHFLSKKLNERIHVLPTVERLQEYLPTDLLPIEYGGKEKSVYKLWDEWLEVLSSPEHQEYLDTMNKICTDESLRTSSKYNEEIMGMPGSFRHLSVD